MTVQIRASESTHQSRTKRLHHVPTAPLVPRVHAPASDRLLLGGSGLLQPAVWLCANVFVRGDGGYARCRAREPECEECVITSLCAAARQFSSLASSPSSLCTGCRCRVATSSILSLPLASSGHVHQACSLATVGWSSGVKRRWKSDGGRQQPSLLGSTSPARKLCLHPGRL